MGGASLCAMDEKFFAGGFLFHPESHKGLLQFRGSRTRHNPNTWCFLGGWREAEDDDSPSATWRREMYEEIGVAIDPNDAVALCDYVPASTQFHRYIFYCEWPFLTENFSIPEDEEDLEAVRWFTLEDALTPSMLLTGGTRRDLLLFQERIRAA
jgi:8-oxo-dGTP pyrophosphatase MutT (NUDIX family)